MFAFIRRIYERSHRGEGVISASITPTDEELAKNEWYKIQEGDSPLWDGTDNAYATIIRRFLVHFHTEVTTNTHKERFAFVNGSIGNFFFAGVDVFPGPWKRRSYTRSSVTERNHGRAVHRV